jgi:hypothetical protein
MTDEEAYQKGVAAGEALVGTCKGLHEIEGAEELQSNSRFCAGLDDTAMVCSECDWWAEPSEINDEGICESCAGASE